MRIYKTGDFSGLSIGIFGGKVSRDNSPINLLIYFCQDLSVGIFVGYRGLYSNRSTCWDDQSRFVIDDERIICHR